MEQTTTFIFLSFPSYNLVQARLPVTNAVFVNPRVVYRSDGEDHTTLTLRFPREMSKEACIKDAQEIVRKES